MPAGRPRKPTALKVLTGNPGKRALNKAEPKPVGQPVPPKTLSKGALAIWKRVTGSMPTATYSIADEGILATYCEAVANHAAATKDIEQNGLLATGSTGQLVANPSVRIQAEQARIIQTNGARLGLDPAARASMNANQSDDDPDDPFAGLIN